MLISLLVLDMIIQVIMDLFIQYIEQMLGKIWQFKRSAGVCLVVIGLAFRWFVVVALVLVGALGGLVRRGRR